MSYMDLYSFVTISIALSVWKIFYALFFIEYRMRKKCAKVKTL